MRVCNDFSANGTPGNGIQAWLMISESFCTSIRKQEKGGFSKGGFCRIQCHAQESKEKPRTQDPAVHLALTAPRSREACSFAKNPPSKSPLSLVPESNVLFLAGEPGRRKRILRKQFRQPPPPIVAKNMPQNMPSNEGHVPRKSLEIKGLSHDCYDIRTPTFMAYEPRLLCHMSRFYWGWGWSSLYWS